MGTAGRHRTPPGLTLVEVLFAAVVLTIGLVGVLTAFSTGYINVVGSGGQSRATAIAQQALEKLKNQAFNPGPVNGNLTTIEAGYTLAAGYTGIYSIAPAVGSPAVPNRLAQITVTVTYTGMAPGTGAHTVQLVTMRAE